MPSPARSTGNIDDDVAGDDAPIGGTNRRPDRRRPRRNVAERLGGQQDRNAIGGTPELRRWRRDVAQFHERVVDERMIDEVDGHGRIVMRKAANCESGKVRKVRACDGAPVSRIAL